MATAEKRLIDGDAADDLCERPAKTFKIQENAEGVGIKQANANGESQRGEGTVKRFGNFIVREILAENSHNKLVFVHGHFEGKDEDAVVTLEKTPFSKDVVQAMLSEQSETNLSLTNDIYSTYQLFPCKEMSGIKASLIYPATKKHIDKYRSQQSHFIHETGENYRELTKPFLESETFSIQWVYNILGKKSEADRIVFEDPDPENGFILLPDMKWDRKQMEDLYLVAIVHQRGIKSMRELTGHHLPLLKNILEKGTAAIADKFGIPSSKLRIFFHYQPSYYHLHVHFTHLKFQAPGSGVERAHLLSDVIENIELDDGFYQKKTLSFTAREEDKLFKLFKDAGKI